MTRDSPAWVAPLLSSALVAGTLDITYAIVFSYLRSGTSPERVLQSVASGALGRAAFSDGVPAAALGLAIHFFIAFTITVISFAVAAHLSARRPLITGPIYACGLRGHELVVIPSRLHARFPRRL